MPRFTLSQLLSGVSLAAIVLAFTQIDNHGEHLSAIESVSFSPDGLRLAVSRIDARDVQTESKKYKADVARTISTVQTRDGSVASVVRRDIRSGSQGPASHSADDGRASAVFNATGQNLILQEFGGGRLEIVPLRSAHRLRPIKSLRHPTFNVCPSTGGRLIAAPGAGQLSVIDVINDRVVLHATTNDMPFLGGLFLAFNQDDTRLAAACDSIIRVWHVQTGGLIATIVRAPGDEWINGIAFGHDGSLVVAAHHSIELWDLSGAIPDRKDPNSWEVWQGLDFPWRRHVELLNSRAGINLDDLKLASRCCAKASPDGTKLVVGHSDGTVTLIDVNTGKRLWTADAPGHYRWPWTAPLIMLVAWSAANWHFRQQIWSPIARSRACPTLSLT